MHFNKQHYPKSNLNVYRLECIHQANLLYHTHLDRMTQHLPNTSIDVYNLYRQISSMGLQNHLEIDIEGEQFFSMFC